MDIDDLTLGEIADIEDYADAPFSEIAGNTRTATKLRIGLAWVLKRREDASFTIDDARKMNMAEVMAFLDGGDAAKK